MKFIIVIFALTCLFVISCGNRQNALINNDVNILNYCNNALTKPEELQKIQLDSFLFLYPNEEFLILNVDSMIKFWDSVLFSKYQINYYLPEENKPLFWLVDKMGYYLQVNRIREKGLNEIELDSIPSIYLRRAKEMFGHNIIENCYIFKKSYRIKSNMDSLFYLTIVAWNSSSELSFDYITKSQSRIDSFENDLYIKNLK